MWRQLNSCPTVYYCWIQIIVGSFRYNLWLKKLCAFGKGTGTVITSVLDPYWTQYGSGSGSSFWGQYGSGSSLKGQYGSGSRLFHDLTFCQKCSVGDPNPNPNPNPKGSERFEGSESDQTVRIRIRIRKDPNANFVL